MSLHHKVTALVVGYIERKPPLRAKPISALPMREHLVRMQTHLIGFFYSNVLLGHDPLCRSIYEKLQRRMYGVIITRY